VSPNSARIVTTRKSRVVLSRPSRPRRALDPPATAIETYPRAGYRDRADRRIFGSVPRRAPAFQASAQRTGEFPWSMTSANSWQILAADVVGYSRLMGRDESGTLARLRDHRSSRLEPTLARYGGLLVKLMGDGALVEFASAVDALSAAIEFQQAMDDVDPDGRETERIVFRIGLHLGDMIVEGDDLYGDGVNIAARLETAAPAGGILVSRTVHEAVTGRLKATFADLGDLALKNIERPVQAFSVKWEPSDWRCPSSLSLESSYEQRQPSSVEQLALPDKPSIAVLPFQNMSGDPEQEYFADGIVEDIITALSRFKSLFVIARSSSFAYKDR